jgi:tetratricopeptide (TPR) repeat protein/predicted Ser/Thr protein kinase
MPPVGDEPGVELPRGAALGRYTIIRRLGAGGMGIVYLAFDPELDRRVAVKLLRTRGSAASESEGEARLLREAQVMAKLSHPNVITVFDVGTFEGDVFVAMEYVKGETLREWWNWPSRTPLETIGIVVQAGRGLAAAHRQGILHRDFKPENVLVDEQGRARVLDFGLARTSSNESSGHLEYDDTLVGRRDGLHAPPLTQNGTVLGTPAYMAPEQLVGAPVDARSDQFAFCITAYEALFGDRPFAGATIGEVEAEISAGRIRPPTTRRPARGAIDRLQSGFIRPSVSAPRGVFAVLARGLARKPEDRWRSMDDLLDALERAAMKSRRKGAIVTGVVAAIALASFVFARPSKAPVCMGAEQSLNGVWNATARDGVASAFRATGNANADAMAGRVTKVLDDYTSRWVAMSTEACTATRVRGAQSDEALDLRTACLHARLDDVRAFAELLQHADSSLVDNAYGASLKLRPLQACADVQALRAAYEPIGDAGKQRAVESLRQETANVTARFNTGRCEETAPLASSLAARARTVDYVPARAEALYASSRVAEACGDPKVAAELLLQTATDAQASHQDDLVARTLTRLAYVEGSALSRYEEGLDFARLAEAAIRRVGSPDPLLADLAQARGWIEYTRGNLEAALPLRKEALDRRIRTSGDDGPDAIQMRAELADLEYEAGALREALEAERTLLQKSIDLLGPGHLRTGRYTLDVAETLVAQGKYAEAAPLLERARPIVGREVGEHLRFVSAMERFGLGEVDEGAAEMAALASQAAAQLGPDDPAPLSYTGDLAKWLVVHRRSQAALELARPLVKRLKELKDTSNPWYSNAYAALALALVRTGHAADATAPAEHAVALAEHGAAQLPFALLARGEAAIANGAAKDAAAPLDRARAMVTARDGIDATILADIDAARALAH